MTGIELIAQERAEQIEKHGKTVEFDAKVNNHYQLRIVAKTLLEGKTCFPDNWDENLLRKMFCKTYKERLIIAGALIAAEIDRIQAEIDKVLAESHRIQDEMQKMHNNRVSRKSVKE
jgi:hypothetical protein